MSDDQKQEVPTPIPTEPTTPEFKKDASSKVVISEDEFKALEAKVLAAKKTPSEEETYKRAIADVRSEIEKTQKDSLEEATKAEQARLLAEMRAELEALKNRPIPGGRKGIAGAPDKQPEGPYRKTADGKLAIPMEEIRRATLQTMFPEQMKNLPRTSPNRII